MPSPEYLTGAEPLPRPHPSVVFCEVEQGAVLLSTESEVYYGLNEVGARIWNLLPPKSLDLASLCAELGRAYPEVDAAALMADVAALLAELVRAGLAVAPEGGVPDLYRL